MKKRWTSLMLAAAISLTALSGCGSEPAADPGAGGTDGASASTKTELNTIYSAELTTLNYLKTTNNEEIKYSYLLWDGLIEFDNYGVMIPSLAEKWEMSDDGLVYTFHLRDGINWFDWQGNVVKPITAQDFVTGLKWVLTKENASANSKTVYGSVKNAEAYYNGEITDFNEVGVKALDEKTVQYTVIKPTPYFLRQISFPAFYPVNEEFLNEQGELFGVDKENILYSGAYLIKKFEPQDQKLLEANPNYWNKDIISIKNINCRYNKEANAIGAELFLRGEIDDFAIPSSILDDWMNDPEKKKLMQPAPLTNMSYFIGFNFDPQFDEEFNPGDWKIAVNNDNFRKSIFHGLDRVSAVMTMEPYHPETKMLNTFSRRGLVDYKGLDYTMMGGLKAYTEGESFDSAKALEYRDKAKAELESQISFPVKILWPVSTAKVENVNRMQVIEQQLEGLLGKDYIDIILESHPGTGFTKQTRRPGKYAMMEMGWGPDFVDPYGSMNPVLSDSLDGTYMRLAKAQCLLDSDGSSKFEKAIEEAANEGLDVEKRYLMFADAETMLLDNAVVIPLYTSGGGYKASYVDPFTRYTGQHGRASATKLKGAKLLDKPMGMDEYEATFEAFEKERLAKLASESDN